MYEYLSAPGECVLNEAVGESIELLDVFFSVVVEIYGEVLEVFVALCVLLAGDIEDMSDAQL